MECPRCGFAHDTSVLECARCGVVVERYRGRRSSGPPGAAVDAPAIAGSEDSRRELYVRALAIPCALAASWTLSAAMPFVAGMTATWVHEGGHAVAAWLSGYAAFPGPWFTSVGGERSLFVTVLLVGLLSFGAYEAGQRRRWFSLAAAVVVVGLTLFCSLALHPLEAQQLITFSGDGGSFVLGTLLMLTMYARDDHPLRRERLRWACLVIGALAFMDARATWFGGVDGIPFGEDDRGLSDPSVLTEGYGWSVALLVGRYVQLANGCLLVLAGGYAIGLATGGSFLKRARTAD